MTGFGRLIQSDVEQAPVSTGAIPEGVAADGADRRADLDPEAEHVRVWVSEWQVSERRSSGQRMSIGDAIGLEVKPDLDPAWADTVLGDPLPWNVRLREADGSENRDQLLTVNGRIVAMHVVKARYERPDGGHAMPGSGRLVKVDTAEPISGHWDLSGPTPMAFVVEIATTGTRADNSRDAATRRRDAIGP